MSSAASYKNPFTDYHANQIDVESLLDYWCDPFAIFSNWGLTENEVYSGNGPLIFIGGRGSGKTMFLRHCSVNVQKAHFDREKSNDQTFLDHINMLGGIGIYIRFDGATLKSFEGSNLTNEVWENLFVHYFELYLAREYLIALEVLEDDSPTSSGTLVAFLDKMCALLGCDKEIETLNQLIDEVSARISEVSDYRGVIGFKFAEFQPTKPIISQHLSFQVPALIKEFFQKIHSKTNFILLLDEFENFSTSQQRMINTLLKFVKPGLTFRIGMRRNGWRTYGTVNDDDFVKEGRDYEKFIFEEILHSKNSGYQEFLIEVARKRLERVDVFVQLGTTDIRHFLGKNEDLEAEALEIAKQDLSKIDNFYKSKFPIIQDAVLLPNKSPLVRILGFLWIIRGESIDLTQKAIIEFENKKRTKLAKRLQYDLVNKYRLSLAIILASIYRTQKLYYSFNTFSYLSSGIVGHFIELCRYTFRYAEFGSDRDYIDGLITKELQGKAAIDVAMNELQQVKRIEKHGRRLYSLVENLGEIFRTYHLDLRIRYPETNQFSLDKSALNDNSMAVFNSALMWSVIQKKSTLQSNAPRSKKTELYTLNRIFSPVFQISYRTRGGINEALNSDDFAELIDEDNVAPKKALKLEINKHDNNQSSLF